MKIKDLPLYERPREKAIRYGITSLSNEELLAVILGSGTREMNVKEVATSLLSAVGGLEGLLTATLPSLMKCRGINKNKALTLTSLVELINRISIHINIPYPFLIPNIIDKYQKLVSFDPQEKVFIIVNNKLGGVVLEKELYKGTSSSVVISTREILKEVYRVNGYSFYLIHTHPHSVSLPSEQDIKITNLIKNKTKKVGIRFVEHYIVSPSGTLPIIKYLEQKDG